MIGKREWKLSPSDELLLYSKALLYGLFHNTHAAVQDILHLFSDSTSLDDKVVLLGVKYETHDKTRLRSAWRSLIRTTYRTGMQQGLVKELPTTPPSYARIYTDSGWGCMFRVAQMFALIIIQKFFLRHQILLSRSSLIPLILDKDVPSAIFSLYSLIENCPGYSSFQVGTWVGPHQISKALEIIFEKYNVLDNVVSGISGHTYSLSSRSYTNDYTKKQINTEEHPRKLFGRATDLLNTVKCNRMIKSVSNVMNNLTGLKMIDEENTFKSNKNTFDCEEPASPRSSINNFIRTLTPTQENPKFTENKNKLLSPNTSGTDLNNYNCIDCRLTPKSDLNTTDILDSKNQDQSLYSEDKPEYLTENLHNENVTKVNSNKDSKVESLNSDDINQFYKIGSENLSGNLSSEIEKDSYWKNESQNSLDHELNLKQKSDYCENISSSFQDSMRLETISNNENYGNNIKNENRSENRNSQHSIDSLEENLETLRNKLEIVATGTSGLDDKGCYDIADCVFTIAEEDTTLEKSLGGILNTQQYVRNRIKDVKLQFVVSPELQTIFYNDIIEVVKKGPTVIAVQTQYGEGNTVNELYLSSLTSLISLPQFVGFMGGKSSQAHMFVGLKGEYELMYMDPHYVQNASSSLMDAHTYANLPYWPLLNMKDIQPSNTIGFLVINLSDWEELWSSLVEISNRSTLPAIQTAISKINIEQGNYVSQEAEDSEYELIDG